MPTQKFELTPLRRAILALLAPGTALAGPTGGDVAGGQASISTPDVTTTVISQQSGRATINWQDFSIAEGESVRFHQPGADSIALNRVTGANPSSIFGELSADGRVFLVNPAGMLFGQSAQVDVAGLVATTLNISDQDFLSGNFRFTDGGNGTVSNAGSINADGGFAVLSAETVENSGTINAENGDVLLASASALTLDLDGSGLISYDISASATTENAGIENLGEIMADGGRVMLDAQLGHALATRAVNQQGLIQARGIEEVDGEIYLTGNGGDVIHSGMLDASGTNGGDGGTVIVQSDQDIELSSGSSMLATGDGAGHGGEARAVASEFLNVADGSTIDVRGGNSSMDGGGFIEVSGFSSVSLGGELMAGSGGQLLIDPPTFNIENNCGALTDCITTAALETQLKAGTDVAITVGSGAGSKIEIGVITEEVDNNQFFLDGRNSGNGGSLFLGVTTGAGDGATATFPADPNLFPRGATGSILTPAAQNDAIELALDGDLFAFAGTDASSNVLFNMQNFAEIGGNFDIRAGGDVSLSRFGFVPGEGDIEFGIVEDLLINADGNVSLAQVVVGEDVDVDAGGNVVLIAPMFQEVGLFAAGDVDIDAIGDITLADFSIFGTGLTAQSLNMNAGNDVVLESSSSINSDGATTITAGNDITDDGMGSFFIVNNSTSSTTLSAGNDFSATATSFGFGSFIGTDGPLSISAGKNITTNTAEIFADALLLNAGMSINMADSIAIEIGEGNLIGQGDLDLLNAPFANDIGSLDDPPDQPDAARSGSNAEIAALIPDAGQGGNPGPNAAFIAPDINIGNFNAQDGDPGISFAGDWLFVQSDSLILPDFVGPFVIDEFVDTQADLLVQFRPFTDTADLYLIDANAPPAGIGPTDVVYSQQAHLNKFDNTTYVFGGNGFSGDIFVGDPNSALGMITDKPDSAFVFLSGDISNIDTDQTYDQIVSNPGGQVVFLNGTQAAPPGPPLPPICNLFPIVCNPNFPEIVSPAPTPTPTPAPTPTPTPAPTPTPTPTPPPTPTPTPPPTPAPPPTPTPTPPPTPAPPPTPTPPPTPPPPPTPTGNPEEPQAIQASVFQDLPGLPTRAGEPLIDRKSADAVVTQTCQ